MNDKVFDVAVIGGGIVGTCLIQRLAALEGAEICLLEANLDVADGATKANSGIVHAGYDAMPGTLKAKFNAIGNKLIQKLCAEHGVTFVNCGSLVVAPEEGLSGLEELKARAAANGVDARIIGRDEILKIEPNVADVIAYALYAPSAGVVSPYRLAIAMADSAVLNGAKIFTDFKVDSIEKKDGVFEVSAGDKSVRAKYVVNAAGCFAPYINSLIGAEEIPQTLRRGEYLLLDVKQRKNINTVIFPLPTAKGKGILVAPTASGNVIYGPTSEDIDAFDTATTAEGLEKIKSSVKNTYKSYDFSQVIKVYAGVRAICGDDFVMGFSKKASDFYTIAGICSPGLTAAPAIAAEVASVFAEKLGLKPKNRIVPAPRKPAFSKLSGEERAKMIAGDPAWGHMVCRCEKVTEAEIVAAIRSPLPAVTTDAVKRRVRAGMGRCSGGFCLPEVMKIISRETGVPLSDVKKESSASPLTVGTIKEGL